jgi:hypothetical protein
MKSSRFMQDGGNSARPAAAIYEECTFLARGFTHVKFKHSPRENNVVAHTLASRVGPQLSVWLEDPPDFIGGLLADDVSLFINQ